MRGYAHKAKEILQPETTDLLEEIKREEAPPVAPKIEEKEEKKEEVTVEERGVGEGLNQLFVGKKEEKGLSLGELMKNKKKHKFGRKSDHA